MSIRLKFQCVRSKKEASFCSGGFESVSYLFLSRPVHTMRLVSQDSLNYNAKTKEMIYESLNLKKKELCTSQNKTL